MTLSQLAMVLDVSKQRAQVVAAAEGFEVIQQGRGMRQTVYAAGDVEAYLNGRVERAEQSKQDEEARLAKLREMLS